MTTYRVDLDCFKGPLDLLLFLVRRDELDVRNLPIARIAKQFAEFLDVLELIDLEFVGEFVLMASTLAEIKSRLVLPNPDEEQITTEPLAENDPRTDLIKQLLEYRKYKDAAIELEERAAEWQMQYPRLANDRPDVTNDPSNDLIKEVELWDLVSALARVLEKKVIEKETKIRDDDTPISVYVGRIGTQVRAEGKIAFTTLFDDATQRSKIVGIFLAILELLRHYYFRAVQEERFGEIWVYPPLEENTEGPPLPHLAGDGAAERLQSETT